MTEFHRQNSESDDGAPHKGPAAVPAAQVETARVGAATEGAAPVQAACDGEGRVLAAPVPAALSHALSSRSAQRIGDKRRGANTRSAQRLARTADTRAVWRRWLAFSAVAGVAAGILWWLLAPGGAFYGDGKDFEMWLPRDATLGLLMLIAGILSAVLVLRGRRATARQGSVPTSGTETALMAALAVGGFAGSVIAWRMGVFAGDLFHTPPDNMANPSIVFSLRSASVLILWPLASVAVVFVSTLVSYSFFPAPVASRAAAAGTAATPSAGLAATSGADATPIAGATPAAGS